MKFHLAETLGEVLAVSLRGGSLREGRLIFPEGALPAPTNQFHRPPQAHA
jgi:hypothetical protein